MIWVTRASSGIGEALAVERAKRGARLMLSSRRREVLESVRATLTDPQSHWVVPLDLGHPESLQQVVDATLPEVGLMDCLRARDH